MSVEVLGIAASPRRKGNTETLLDWALEAAAEAGAQVVKFRLRELEINPCIACDGCFDDGACIVEDDMEKLYPHLKGADSIILAAPIFSMGLAAQAKAMVDRCQPFWAVKYVLRRSLIPPGRPERMGAFLSCAGTRYKTVFDGARQVVRYFWHVLEVQPAGEILCPGVDAKGEINDYPSAREVARDIGRRLAVSR
ncbi:MAG: flavodoxin family protein [Thermoleophilia bacterium]|nr:flavodoxin family protein [Actinomycetota bacterium]